MNYRLSHISFICVAVTSTLVLIGCPAIPLHCESDPEILTTADEVEFVRTPDERFENLPDFSFERRFVEIDGLRQGYVDEGPIDADPVLLLHGQPIWSCPD